MLISSSSNTNAPSGNHRPKFSVADFLCEFFASRKHPPFSLVSRTQQPPTSSYGPSVTLSSLKGVRFVPRSGRALHCLVHSYHSGLFRTMLWCFFFLSLSPYKVSCSVLRLVYRWLLFKQKCILPAVKISQNCVRRWIYPLLYVGPISLLLFV